MARVDEKIGCDAKIFRKITVPRQAKQSYLEFVIERSLGKAILKANHLSGRLLVDVEGNEGPKNRSTESKEYQRVPDTQR